MKTAKPANPGIERNVASRKAAELCVEFINDSLRELINTHSVDALPVFFSVLRGVYGKNLTVIREPSPPKPMSESEAKTFGETEMPFGKHKGETISEVPLSYLDWISEQPDDFKEKLNRYLMSDTVRRERESADEDDE